MIDLERRHDIYDQWKRFGNGEPLDTAIIHPYLIASWERSRAFGLPRRIEKLPTASSGELINRIHESRRMLGVAVPYMKKIISFMNDPESIIMITDGQGIVLELFGSPDMLALDTAPKLGSRLREEDIGTNAVGTALIEDRTLDIWAGEHYLEALHYWYASGDTIHDKEGKILGCLCLICRWDLVNAHSLGLVGAVAGAIERQLHIEDALAEKTVAMQKQQAIVESITEGIVVIDGDEKIREINPSARRMLGLGSEDHVGRSVYTVIPDGINFFKIMADGANILDREAVLSLRDRRKLHCAVSAALIESDGAVGGMVITLKEAKSLHQLAGKIAGSRAYLSFSDIIGASQSLQEAVKLARTAAKSRSNVLLLGESGTGKELFAQSIHNFSDRAAHSFVAVNCGALPRDLVESELFGYEGGAFTGSKKEGRPGKFELADEGTIFLDEIGDMPLEAQVNLLRVLQSSEVVRVGGTYPKKIDVRVIAATNHDLKKAVEQKAFRDDLYYRLNVLAITIPPLRERAEDIEPLALHFAKRSANAMNKPAPVITPDAMRLLKSYPWPGNIRELENVLERAVNIMERPEITPAELPDHLRGATGGEPLPEGPSLRAREYETILRMLEQTGGNLRAAAGRLGIARGTLYNKIVKYQIDLEKLRRNG